MSVTDDGIPHGLQGYRRFGCKCDICRAANRDYFRARRAKDNGRERAKKAAKDELAAKRAARSAQCRAASAKRQPSQDDSVKTSNAKKIGEMEKAVVDAATKLDAAEDKPDIVMMARNMARILDNPKQVALHPSTNRQLMALMTQLRGDGSPGRGGRRKSGGRLAAVQKMTRSKRSVAQ